MLYIPNTYPANTNTRSQHTQAQRAYLVTLRGWRGSLSSGRRAGPTAHMQQTWKWMESCSTYLAIFRERRCRKHCQTHTHSYTHTIKHLSLAQRMALSGREAGKHSLMGGNKPATPMSLAKPVRITGLLRALPKSANGWTWDGQWMCKRGE